MDVGIAEVCIVSVRSNSVWEIPGSKGRSIDSWPCLVLFQAGAWLAASIRAISSP
jgi:hypothetical protein